MELNQKNITSTPVGCVLRDKSTKGLHLRVFKNRKSFYLYFRTKTGDERRPKLGNFPTISLAAARRMASDLLEEVGKGKDPINALRLLRDAPTMADLCEKYMTNYAAKKKSKAQDQRMIDSYIKPELEGKRVADVRQEDIENLHRKMKRTPYQANRVLSLLSKMMNLAAKWHMCEGQNPCLYLDRYPEKKRIRYLSADEAKALHKVMQEKAVLNPHSVAFLYLLIYSGARKSEIANARWQWLDRDVLHLPDSKTGTRDVYLPPEAMKVLETLPRRQNQNSTICGIESPTKLWQVIRKEAGCSDLRIHDLRHSFASAGLAAGLTLEQIGGLLGHKSAQTTKRYAHLMEEVGRTSAAKASALIAQRMMAEAILPSDS
jgi:integrase